MGRLKFFSIQSCISAEVHAKNMSVCDSNINVYDCRHDLMILRGQRQVLKLKYLCLSSGSCLEM